MPVSPIKESAARIQRGIAEHGIYVLHTADLNVIWNESATAEHDVKRMQIMNFAQYYGFKVRLDHDLTMAVFRKDGG